MNFFSNPEVYLKYTSFQQKSRNANDWSMIEVNFQKYFPNHGSICIIWQLIKFYLTIYFVFKGFTKLSYYIGAFSVGAPLIWCSICKTTIIFWNFRFYLLATAYTKKDTMNLYLFVYLWRYNNKATRFISKQVNFAQNATLGT